MRFQEWWQRMPFMTRCFLVLCITVFVACNVHLVSPRSLAFCSSNAHLGTVFSFHITHSNPIHLLVNLTSLAQLFKALETQINTLPFLFYIVCILMPMVSGVYVLVEFIFKAVMRPTCVIGASGLLFASLVIHLYLTNVTHRTIWGVRVPSSITPFVIAIIAQLIFPNASWTGHLAGIASGWISVLIWFRHPSPRFFISSLHWKKLETWLRLTRWECYCAIPESSVEGQWEVLSAHEDELETGNMVQASDTPMSQVCQAMMDDDIGQVERLLQEYENECVQFQTRTGESLLHVASVNNTSMLQVILPLFEAKFDMRDLRGRTSLHAACAAGNVSNARILLENGADVDALDHLGESPLSLCISHRSSNSESQLIDVLNLLLEFNVNVNLPNRFGVRPLHHAVEMCHAQLIKVLLKAGADPAKKDSRGRSPITIAEAKDMSHLFKS